MHVLETKCLQEHILTNLTTRKKHPVPLLRSPLSMMVSMITRASTRALFCVSLISSRAGNNSLILDPCEDATGNFPTGNLSTGCIPRTFVLAACRCSFLFSFLLSLLLFRAISLELFIISMRVKAASLSSTFPYSITASPSKTGPEFC